MKRYPKKYDVHMVGKFIEVKDLYVLGLIKDKKIVEVRSTVPSNTEGYRAIVIDTDITTVDYILSYDNWTEKVTVIPNPLKK